MQRKNPLRIVLIALAASLLSACIFFPSAKDRALRKTPSFKEGYGDGCAAASTQSSNYREGPYRDKALYQSDAAYRAGWANGYQTCRAPQDLGTMPGQNPVPQPLPGR
ncbi:MAG TPA: hypothetical protein VMU22_01100 [Rhizomicrobium sp.]|nr:hypothetical protein [Rhizomicrobium sp.]